MSSSTNSGRKLRAASRAAGPSWATIDLVAEELEEPGQPAGRVHVVVDDEDAGRLRAGGGRRAGLRSLGRGRASCQAGSRTANSLPLPGPSLVAATLPPCISTSFLTSVSPMPSPPPTAVERAVALGEELEDLGQHLGRDARSRVPDADDDLVPLAARP